MKAGILLCDHTREHLQPRFGDYPQMFERMLNELHTDIEVTIFDLTTRSYPRSANDADIFFITGSKKSCYESIDWIDWLKDFVIDCQHNATKLVGICFGHQLIAHALGGMVERSEKGWGIGIHNYRILHDRESFDGRDYLYALVSHRDQIIKAPTGSRLHATNDFCPNAMLSYGDNIISVQGHPELTREYIQTILDIRREEIGEQAYYQAQLDFKKSTDNHLLVNGMLRWLGL